MRTTLTLEPDAFAAAQAYAQARAMKLGAAVSELIRQARMPAVQLTQATNLRPMPGAEGLWELDVPPSPVTKTMTSAEVIAMIHAAEQEEDDRSIAFSLGVPLDAPLSLVKAALRKAKSTQRLPA